MLPEANRGNALLATAKLPVLGSTAQLTGELVSASVEIGWVPPCAYSRISSPFVSATKTSPLGSEQSPCGSLKPVNVPTSAPSGNEKTSTVSAPTSDTYKR